MGLRPANDHGRKNQGRSDHAADQIGKTIGRKVNRNDQHQNNALKDDDIDQSLDRVLAFLVVDSVHLIQRAPGVVRSEFPLKAARAIRHKATDR